GGHAASLYPGYNTRYAVTILGFLAQGLDVLQPLAGRLKALFLHVVVPVQSI
ncbi:hypothetical protein J6590_104532, partial [Homalodisca vitripennis]